jgi:hypothetical protein
MNPISSMGKTEWEKLAECQSPLPSFGSYARTRSARRSFLLGHKSRNAFGNPLIAHLSGVLVQQGSVRRGVSESTLKISEGRALLCGHGRTVCRRVVKSQARPPGDLEGELEVLHGCRGPLLASGLRRKQQTFLAGVPRTPRDAL